MVFVPRKSLYDVPFPNTLNSNAMHVDEHFEITKEMFNFVHYIAETAAVNAACENAIIICPKRQ